MDATSARAAERDDELGDETGDETGAVSRRTLLKLGTAGGVGVALAAGQWLGSPLSDGGILSLDGPFEATSTALADVLFYTEVYPTARSS
jgi:hypothetical protein